MAMTLAATLLPSLTSPLMSKALDAQPRMVLSYVPVIHILIEIITAKAENSQALQLGPQDSVLRWRARCEYLTPCPWKISRSN